MYSASCLCGEVHMTINGPISDIIHCHCSLCRKSSGTAFATNGFIDSQSLTIKKGQEFINSFEVKPGRKRHFCKQCASPLFSSNADDPTRLRLRLGVLDCDIDERPMSHNFVDSKANWDSLNIDLPHYSEFEPSRSK